MPKPQHKSKCCKAPFAIKENKKGYYFYCKKCGKPCDTNTRLSDILWPKTNVIAGHTPWVKTAFGKMSGDWQLVTKPSQLKNLDTRYIFFIHWSWKVPPAILRDYECVCFHMTDVPYGRGGSPLQNLILRGHKKTKLTALRMTENLDAGPVYLKRPLSLEGTAEEIYLRMANLAIEMIPEIMNKKPKPQKGKPVIFKRRTPKESEIPTCSIKELYDFIRMLDAQGYPRAFIKYKEFIIEFSNAKLNNHDLLAHVEIRKVIFDEYE